MNRHTQKVQRNFSFYNNFTNDKILKEIQNNEIEIISLTKNKRKQNLEFPQLDKLQIEIVAKDQNGRYKK